MIKTRLLICLLLYIIGYSLLIYFTNWQSGLAVFIIQWADNVENRIKYVNF
jgi:hypothetical protein